MLAPNRELVELLHRRTGRPAFLMQRGVDTVLFSPEKRDRTDEVLNIGFVGRLSPEKNVRALGDVEQGLTAAGVENFVISVIGDGHERGWLEANMKRVKCADLLFGEDPARALCQHGYFRVPVAHRYLRQRCAGSSGVRGSGNALGEIYGHFVASKSDRPFTPPDDIYTPV